MSLKSTDVVVVEMSDEEISECVQTAIKLCDTIIDRHDLHERDYLERLIDIIMGEIAEQVVIKWLHSNGKYAISAVDKTSGKPDAGHDIIVKAKTGRKTRCSIKSSLSVMKANAEDIISTFQLASKPSEMREINIQVYFWLRIFNKDLENGTKPRINTPSTNNLAIIGWASDKDIKKSMEIAQYSTEKRQTVDIKLCDLRPMSSLLDNIADNELDDTTLEKETFREESEIIKKIKRCPSCDVEMVVREGPYGKFYGCPNFPECKHTEKYEQ